METTATPTRPSLHRFPKDATKADEIQYLSELIGTLPEASYLKPWLVEAFPHVEQAIRSDFLPTRSPREYSEDMIKILNMKRKAQNENRQEESKQRATMERLQDEQRRIEAQIENAKELLSNAKAAAQEYSRRLANV